MSLEGWGGGGLGSPLSASARQASPDKLQIEDGAGGFSVFLVRKPSCGNGFSKRWTPSWFLDGNQKETGFFLGTVSHFAKPPKLAALQSDIYIYIYEVWLDKKAGGSLWSFGRDIVGQRTTACLFCTDLAIASNVLMVQPENPGFASPRRKGRGGLQGLHADVGCKERSEGRRVPSVEPKREREARSA